MNTSLKEYVMKKRFAVISAAGIAFTALMAASPASAREQVQWSVTVGGGSHTPPVAYYPPATVYQPRPVYVERPIVVMHPQPYYYGEPSWREHHEHRKHRKHREHRRHGHHGHDD
jgi:hypothetical protein